MRQVGGSLYSAELAGSGKGLLQLPEKSGVSSRAQQRQAQAEAEAKAALSKAESLAVKARELEEAASQAETTAKVLDQVADWNSLKQLSTCQRVFFLLRI